MQGGGRGFDSPRLHHPRRRSGRDAPRAARRNHRRTAAPPGVAIEGPRRSSEAPSQRKSARAQTSYNTVGARRRAGSRPAAGAWAPGRGRRNGSRECLTKGQATKGARRMPRRHGPMKDVARLRKAPASCLASSTGDLRMGQPGPLHRGSRPAEHIGRIEGTGGTETSQYPEEKKRFPQ